VRGAGASRVAAALRLPPGDGRRAEELGGAERAFARPEREAAGDGGRGPPGRVPAVHGRDPRGELRGRNGLPLGHRHLRNARARPAARVGARRAAPDAAREATAGRMAPLPPEAWFAGEAAVAAAEGERRV